MLILLFVFLGFGTIFFAERSGAKTVNNPPVALPDVVTAPGLVLSHLGNAHDNDYDPDGDQIIGHYTHYWTEAAPVGRGYVSYTGGIAVTGGTVSGSFDIPYGITDNRGGHAYSSVTAHVTASGGAENAGRSCPEIAKPVNVTNGNMWIEHSDYDLPGIGERIEIKRFYNSMIQSSGMFGFGWSTKYDESLWIHGDRLLRLNLPDARAIYFGRRLTTGPFEPLTYDFQGQVVKDPDGTFLLSYKDGRTHKFDQTGKLLWQRDRNQNQTTLAYDVNGRLATVTDALGRTLTFTMSANGYVEEISDALSSVATYEYFPGTPRLKTVTFADGSKYKFEYNTTAVSGKVFLATVKDALDNILETHLYDSNGRATTSELQGGVEKYEFDYSNLTGSNPYSIVKHKKNAADPYIQTKFYFKSFRGRNEVTKTEGLCGCGGSGSEITQNVYDSQARLEKTIDALGRETVYTYDSNRNVIQTVDDLGTQKWTYNAFGQVLTYKDHVDSQNPDPNVKTFSNTYNSNGDLLTSTDALGNVTTFTYSTIGQPLTIKDARNKITTLTWDSSGRMTQIKDANNKTTNFAYDARARVTGTTNALSHTTSFEYDLNNRLKKVIYPDTNFIENTYDLAGRRTVVRDPRGNVTNFAYDGAYRLTSVIDPLSHATTYGYDLMSNLVSQTDALGNVTNLEYDDFNRLKRVIYPAATTGATRLEESLNYDLNGNVKTRVDTAGRTTTYDYDTSNRLIKITDALLNQTQFEYNLRSQMTKVKDALNQEYIYTYDPLGRALTQTRAGATMSFEYDAVGNRTKRTDYRGRETSYVYDNLNRLTQINYLQSFNGTPPQTPIKTATYGYDDLSRLLTAANDAGTVTFTYDNRGRLKTETDVFGHVTERAYDANSNRTQLKLNGDIHSAYAYDAANRLTTLTDDASQNFTYGYDIANRLISNVVPNGITSTFEFDGMNRLKKLKHQSASATLTENDFTYNAANQIGQIAELAQTKNFAYDNVDRLTGMTNGTANESYAFDAVGNRTASHRSASYTHQPFNKLTATANATFSYDANGNMLSKSDPTGYWIYGWDHENRMISARKQNKIVRYEYDALGRRVSRSGKTLGSTKYTYDGLDVVMEVDFKDGIVKYQNGPGIDNKLKMLVGGQAKYFLQDHLGSTVGLADSSGNLTSSASYDSFGNSTNNLTTRYLYTGREHDSFTGLQYNRARWYDPRIGRFVSEDPIGLNGGFNLYEYAKSNPVRYTDPTGEIPNPYDFFWWLYYSMRCGEDGIQCANACNSSNQSQADLELTMQEAFDSGAGNLTGLRYRNCFSANYFCEQQLYYSGRVFEGSHPLNPYKTTGRAIRDYKKNIQPGEVY